MKIGNYNLNYLKKEYGTPLYLYDEKEIINKIKLFKENFKHENFKTTIIYASKAFLPVYMAKLINQEKLSLDCVSSGELYTASKAGFDFSRVFLHGNNKTLEELEEALNYGVGTIILDNLYEAELLLSLKNKKYLINVMLRVNLAFEVNTHNYIKTSYPDSKFGVLINEETIKMIKRLINDKSINFIGLHSHIGSQLLDENYFYDHAKVMLTLYKNLKEEYQISLKAVNLGGGFGIKYLSTDKKLNLNKLLPNLVNLVDELNNDYNLNLKEIMIEPGRSIIGEAGYTLYTINQIKKTLNKKYLFVDGSMNDNIRPALYQARYEAIINDKENAEKLVNYTIAGKACESGDILIENIILPEAEVNDLLLVKSTGAYHYSMASNYNKFLIPPVIFINEEEIKVIVKREKLEDLIKNDF